MFFILSKYISVKKNLKMLVNKPKIFEFKTNKLINISACEVFIYRNLPIRIFYSKNLIIRKFYSLEIKEPHFSLVFEHFRRNKSLKIQNVNKTQLDLNNLFTK